MINFERGSEWRRWDLHMHSPETKKNDNFIGSSVEEKWNNYYKSINDYIGNGTDPNHAIAVIGITDYLSIDNYLKVKNDNKITDVVKMILPNVELRMEPIAKNSPINIHCIFNPEIVDELERIFFSKLKFSYLGRDYSATHEELIDLGRAYKEDHNLDEKLAYKYGINQFVITLDDLKNIFKSNEELRDNCLIAVSNSSGDGVSGITEHYSYLIQGDSQLNAKRREIYRFSDIIFSGKEKDVQYFLGKSKTDDKDRIKYLYKSLKPCVNGSDAHNNTDIFEPFDHRYCWIKADPTFNGLRQVLYEPEDRVKISQVIPDSKPTYEIIDSIEFNNDDFQTEIIPISDKLTCIIGGKSTGKSLLLHNMALAIDKTQVEEKSKVTQIANKNVIGTKVYWRDGEISDLNSDDKHKIIYIPQTYLNRLSDEQEELTEIDEIIQSIIMINYGVKKSYENMIQLINEQKVIIDKELYSLIQTFDNLGIIKEELEDIGVLSGIEKEIVEIKKQKDALSKELSISAEEIVQYDEAITEFNQITAQLEVLECDIEKIENIESVVSEKVLDFRLSESTIEIVKNAIDKSIIAANEQWEQEKNTIISNLKKNKEELDKRKKKKQEIIDKYSGQISGNEAVKKLSEQLREQEEKRSKYIEKFKQYNSKLEEYNRGITDISKTYNNYRNIHVKYAKEVNDILRTEEEGLKFSVQTPFRKEAFLKEMETVFNKTDLKKLFDVEKFDSFWVNEDNIKILIDMCIKEQIKTKNAKTTEMALRQVLVDWNNSSYIVEMDGDSISEMSPGKKALVLLKMLINLAESECPILIDQPEDDLDNRSIFDELIPFIKQKKLKRQIIIVTHNANVVLGADAEEVIVANQNGKNSPNLNKRFEYRTGSIEDDKPILLNREDVLGKQGIQQHICDILEGGVTAFDLRKNKYRM